MLIHKGLVIALMLVTGAAVTIPLQAKQTADARAVPLTIVSGARQYSFKVEVAETPSEQARGLMFRTHLAPDRGMIFPMAPPRFSSFWMKNTRIPLDMVFIRADGTIANIAERAVPYSLTPVSSYEPVAAVLEIPGGRAAALGIKPGDKVNWRAR